MDDGEYRSLVEDKRAGHVPRGLWLSKAWSHQHIPHTHRIGQSVDIDKR